MQYNTSLLGENSSNRLQEMDVTANNWASSLVFSKI